MAKIVISYRRSDSAAIAGRIRDRLVARYGDQSIFMDIEDIPLGDDFRTHIRDTLLQGDVLLAILGPKWLGRGKGAPSRIMNEVDPVRIEIETALQGRIPAIPVLVNSARMPDAADLPESLKDFAFLNAAEVDTGRDFHQHMDRLVGAIDAIVKKKSQPSPAPSAPPPLTSPTAAVPRTSTNWMPVAAALAVLVAAGGAGAWYFTSAPKIAAVQTPPASLPVATAPAPPPAPAPTTSAAAPPPSLAPTIAAVPPAASSPPSPAAAAPAVAPAPTPPTNSTTSVASLPAPVPDQAVAGCDRRSALFADDFQAQTDNWVRLGKTAIGSTAYYDKGEMVLAAATQNTKWIVTPDLTFDDATICAEIKSPANARDLDRTAGGIVFWSRPGSMDDVYAASIYPDGSFAIMRKNDGTWSTVTAKRKFDSIRPGLNAKNQIKLTLKDRTATLYINGVKAQEFQGDPPDDGGVVGLFARSETDRQNEWRFSKIVVSE